MEHKKGFGKDDFYPDEDFDKELDERTSRWQAESISDSIQADLDSQKILPIISDKKIQNVVNAEVKSSESILSVTVEVTEVSKDSSASDVVSEPDNLITESAPTLAEVDQEYGSREILSDPNYSKNIIEGKVTKPVIRGIAEGPWARLRVESEVVSQEKALENIGHPILADFWRRITISAKHCGGDIEKLIDHIAMLKKAAFFQEWAIHAYEAELKRVIAEGSEAERAKAEELYAKMHREAKKRTMPDGSSKKSSKSSGDKPNKPAKAEKLEAATKKTIDIMVGYRMTYDMLVERLKAAGKLNNAALEYVKEQFGKASV